MPIRLKIACFVLTSVAGLFSATCAGIKVFQIHLIEATEDRTRTFPCQLLPTTYPF